MCDGDKHDSSSTNSMIRDTAENAQNGGFQAEFLKGKEFSLERRQYDFIIEAAGVGTWQWNMMSGEILCNEIWAEMLGYRLEELEPLTLNRWRELVHPDDLTAVLELLEEYKSGERVDYSTTYRMCHRDGHDVWILDRGRVVSRDAEHRPLMMFGTHIDVSEQKATEEALRESSVYHRALVQNTTDAFWLLDSTGRFMDVNKACVRLLGYSREQLLSMRVQQIEAKETAKETDAHLKTILENGADVFETRLRASGGEQVPVELSVSYDAARSGRYIVFARDLRERQRQHEHDLLLGHILDAAPLAIMVYSYSGDFYYANRHAVHLYGYDSLDELLCYKRELHKDEAYQVLLEKQLIHLREEGETSFETEHRSKDGSVLVLDVIAKDILWHGKPAVLTISTDVTEQKRAHAALEKRLVALTKPLDSSHDLGIEDLFNMEDLQRLQDEFAQATQVASLITLPDGTPLTRPSNFTHLCDKLIRGTSKGRENCRKSDAYLGRFHPEGPVVAPCASCGLWDAGTSISVGGKHVASWFVGQVRDNTQSIDTIRAYAREIGMDEEKAAKAFEKVPEMSRERFEQIAALLFTMANRLSDMAYQNVQQARFIQERRAAEGALRLSEERFRLLLNETPMVSVQGYQPDGTLLFWNEGAHQLYGYTVEEAVGANMYQLIMPEQMREKAQEAIARMAAGGELEPPAELELKHRDGHSLTVFSSHCVIRRPGQPVELYCVDIDLRPIREAEAERERLREQLVQAQKMESIGRLAGGVAHDFNNLLSVILGNAEILLDDLPVRSEFRDSVEEIQQAAQRSADLTRQLLAFARKQTVAPRILDLNDTVESMLKMLRRLLGEDIELVWEPARVSHSIYMDPAQVDQVLANLCVNARDAIKRADGRIVIRSQAIRITEEDCHRDSSLQSGSYMLLEVCDNGEGMDEHTLENIFEPFFTTKGLAEGTGLGLATVFGVVQQNEGFIRVDSRPGEGSCFRLYLPIAEAETPQVYHTNVGERRSGSETILLVEDEPVLLTISKRMLERMGYTVLTAQSPRRAIELADEYSGRIDLIMSDVVMPEMNGSELVRTLVSTYPNLRAIFMSGYPADIIARQGVLHGNVAFLQKPFTQDLLASKLREALDANH